MTVSLARRKIRSLGQNWSRRLHLILRAMPQHICRKCARMALLATFSTGVAGPPLTEPLLTPADRSGSLRWGGVTRGDERGVPHCHKFTIFAKVTRETKPDSYHIKPLNCNRNESKEDHPDGKRRTDSGDHALRSGAETSLDALSRHLSGW